MHPLIEQHQEAIRALCVKYGVSRLELFGSAATDAFDPDDDFSPWLARYFELRDNLQILLGRPVDLVMASAIRKPPFIQAANETRQVTFDAPVPALIA
jgi:predicted nucleotidyltransferase